MPKKTTKTSEATLSSDKKVSPKEIFLDIRNLDLLICLIVVILLFLPTLNRGWLTYDERIISDGLYFPTPRTFSEIFEIIEKFGLNFNIISSNTLYSSNYITRSSPLGQVFWLFINFFFKQNPFFYHTFNLILHLINTSLFYFVLKVVFTTLKNLIPFSRLILILLTLIWAIHPVNLEGVLLATNAGALFSYLFFLGFLLDYLINKDKNNTSLLREFLIPIIFLIPMLMNEYIIMLPFVFFIISFHESYQNLPFKKAINKSLGETKPYFIGFVFYLIYYLFLSKHNIGELSTYNQAIVLLERVFWLAPQIFFHLLKLVFYPKILSIDQTLFVNLGKTLLDPYAIFCILFLLIWLFLPLVLFLLKKRFQNLFLLTWAFFFSLLPFLHILVPSYLLASERYLYCALALLIFSLAKIITSTPKLTSVVKVSTLSILLLLCFTRSSFRTSDWKNNFTFINSTYKTLKDPLYKAMRLGMLAKVMTIDESTNTEKIQKYFTETLSLLEKARENTIKDKFKYQKSLPTVIKAYGLDYDSLLAKIAFLEASSRCLELKQDYKIGLQILEPSIKNIKRTEPRILQLYAYFLTLDKNHKKAKEVLLAANKNYPHTPFILLDLIELTNTYENNKEEAEKHLTDGLKYHLYDPNILFKAIGFYQSQNNPFLTAKYAHLFGLRANSRIGYRQALAAYLELENLKEAKKIVFKLVKMDPNDLDTLYFASKYYYKVKDYQRALALLKLAYSGIKIPGTDLRLAFDITNTLAKLYLFLGDKDQAITLSKQVSTLAQNDLEALKKLASLYESLGLTENLNACLRKITQLSMNIKSS